jgi:hypothetical protein
MKKKYTIGGIILLLIIVAVAYSQFSRPREVLFFTEYSIEPGERMGAMQSWSVDDKIIFSYKGKEYDLIMKSYGRICRPGATEITEDLMEECLNTPDYYEINETVIEAGKIKIKGTYNPVTKELTDYLAVKR